MNIFTWFIIGIGVFLIGIFLFTHIVGWMVDEGFKARDDCYYDPDKNNWYPFVSFTEEQRSRIVKGSRNLRTMKDEEG